MEAEAELRAELTTFHCKECYVYKLPPASSIGHRAESWDVDHWLQEVSLKVVTCNEECTIKMFDFKSGGTTSIECMQAQTFDTLVVVVSAKCWQVVEAVVDSSRYFALKIEDRASKRHAFIGIGFRERTQASDFNAALHEHTQYLRRKKEAQESRQAYESTADDGESGASSSSHSELSLKPGETITLKLAKSQLSPSSSQALPRLTSRTAKLPQFQVQDNGAGQIPLLAPPPASLSSQLPSQLSGPQETSAQQPAQTKSDNPELPNAAHDGATQAARRQQDDKSSQAEDSGAARIAGDSRQPSSSLPESNSQQEATKPAADDWGEFVT